MDWRWSLLLFVFATVNAHRVSSTLTCLATNENDCDSASDATNGEYCVEYAFLHEMDNVINANCDVVSRSAQLVAKNDSTLTIEETLDLKPMCKTMKQRSACGEFILEGKFTETERNISVLLCCCETARCNDLSTVKKHIKDKKITNLVFPKPKTTTSTTTSTTTTTTTTPAPSEESSIYNRMARVQEREADETTEAQAAEVVQESKAEDGPPVALIIVIVLIFLVILAAAAFFVFKKFIKKDKEELRLLKMKTEMDQKASVTKTAVSQIDIPELELHTPTAGTIIPDTQSIKDEEHLVVGDMEPEAMKVEKKKKKEALLAAQRTQKTKSVTSKRKKSKNAGPAPVPPAPLAQALPGPAQPLYANLDLAPTPPDLPDPPPPPALHGRADADATQGDTPPRGR